MKSVFVVMLCSILLHKMTGTEISLNSTLIRGMYALPNQEVIFTCISRNATVVNWNSTEYIGAGNIFPIASIGPARNRTRGTTVATRLDTYVEGGSTVIVSQLHIIASEEFPNSAVTCRVNGEGPSETIHFITTENALQEVSLNSTLIHGVYALPNQVVTFTCISRNATVVNWNSTEYIGAGNIFPISSFGPARNRTRGTTVATRLDTYVEGGSTVIASQLRIIASEEFPKSAVTCRVNGEGPSETIHFITTEVAGTTTSVVETMDISTDGNDDVSFVIDNYESTQKSATCIGFCGFGIGIGVLFVVFIGVVTIIVIVIVKRMREGMKINDIESPRRSSNNESEKPDPQKDEREEGDDIKQQPENEVISVTTDEKPPATLEKETNEEPDYIEPLEESEKKPLLGPICVGIGNTGLIVPGREISNIWKQPVGLARCISLPSVHVNLYTRDEVTCRSLPLLFVDGSTSLFTRYDFEQHGIDADIESGSDIHEPSTPLEVEANEKPDKVEPQKKSEKKYLLDLDIKKQDVTHDEAHSSTGFGDSGVDDDSTNGSECEMESQAIKKREQVGEGHSEDSGVDNDSSNGSECEMESKLAIKKREQVSEVPEVENETVQNPDSEEKPDRDSGVVEPEDNGGCTCTPEENIRVTLCPYESPHEYLVSFEAEFDTENGDPEKYEEVDEESDFENEDVTRDEDHSDPGDSGVESDTENEDDMKPKEVGEENLVSSKSCSYLSGPVVRFAKPTFGCIWARSYVVNLSMNSPTFTLDTSKHQLWCNTFRKAFEFCGHAFSSTPMMDRDSSLPSTGATPNSIKLYRLFQQILKVHNKEHQILFKECHKPSPVPEKPEEKWKDGRSQESTEANTLRRRKNRVPASCRSMQRSRSADISNCK